MKYYLSPSGFCKKVGYFVIALLFVLNIGNTTLFLVKYRSQIQLPVTFQRGKKLASKMQRAQLFQWKWLTTTILWGNREKDSHFWEHHLSISSRGKKGNPAKAFHSIPALCARLPREIPSHPENPLEGSVLHRGGTCCTEAGNCLVMLNKPWG